MNNKRKKLIIIVVVSALFIVMTVGVLFFLWNYYAVKKPEMILEQKYELACEYFEDGEYEEAIQLFDEIIDYKNSKRMIKKAKIEMLLEDIDSGKYVSVADIYEYGHSHLGEFGIGIDGNDLLTETQTKELDELLHALHCMTYGDIDIIGDGRPFSHEEDSYFASFDAIEANVYYYDENRPNNATGVDAIRPNVDFWRGVGDGCYCVLAVKFEGDHICTDIQIWKVNRKEDNHKLQIEYTLVPGGDGYGHLSWQSSKDSDMYLMSLSPEWEYEIFNR